MTQTYTKGSNPYFEYAMLKYSQVAVIERMQKDDVLEHIKTLDFQSVVNVWELIHTHLENVNLSLNAYNYSNYTLPTTEKPISKFDFITKNSKAIGAYQSGVLVNDFSYFVDSNTIAKSKANEFSQRKYELLHKVSAFTHLENKAELASVEARKAFFEAFLTILHKLHNADFEAKINQINAELAPHLFIPEKYIRLENRQKTFNKMVEVVVKKPIQKEVKSWRNVDKYMANRDDNYKFVMIKESGGYSPFTGKWLAHDTREETFGHRLGYWFYEGNTTRAYVCSADGNNQYGFLCFKTDVFNSFRHNEDGYLSKWGTYNFLKVVQTATKGYVTEYIDVVEQRPQSYAINYMIEVEYQTQYGKDKLPNETPPAEPYKIKKLNGSWVTHDNQPLDTAGKSEDEILQM